MVADAPLYARTVVGKSRPPMEKRVAVPAPRSAFLPGPGTFRFPGLVGSPRDADMPKSAGRKK